MATSARRAASPPPLASLVQAMSAWSVKPPHLCPEIAGMREGVWSDRLPMHGLDCTPPRPSTALRLERDTWSMVKWLRLETTFSTPLPPPARVDATL